MNKTMNQPAGQQTGKGNYERREDQQEGDGRRESQPRSQTGGDDEEE